MIYVTINEAFYHNESLAKSLLDLNICQGILGYPPYGVKQIAQDQAFIGAYQPRALLLKLTKNN